MLQQQAMLLWKTVQTHRISDNHMMLVVLSMWKVLHSNEHVLNDRVCGIIGKWNPPYYIQVLWTCIISIELMIKIYRLHVNDVYNYLFENFPSLLWVGSTCFRFSMRFTFSSQSGLDLQVGCPRYLLRTLLSSQPQIWIFSTKKIHNKWDW
jgi:hypothetical protein